ncbi:hypothetical protein IJG20_00180 [Candidatus Saccharibacteria bacterium]|nr:hypothetical protein [Candidatus Saccharibacteria bacterium]
MTDSSSEKKSEKSPKMSSGSRNLLLLGLGATFITLLFTVITLKIYHDSGDIYLDRSRPGFLPKTEEAEQDKDDTDYELSDSGAITGEVLDEYLENLVKELDRLNDFSEPFGSKPLSDESLGI